MKTTILILCISLVAITGLSVVVLPPTGDTNKSAEIQRANRISSNWANYYYRNGRIDRLEHEVNRLETGFVIVAVLLGSTFSALVVLAARDRIRERKPIQKTASKKAD